MVHHSTERKAYILSDVLAYLIRVVLEMSSGHLLI